MKRSPRARSPGAPRPVVPADPASLSPLARELGKLRPFEHVEVEAHLALLRTTTSLRGDVERLFKQHGLSESTYNILRILRHAPDGRSCSEVGERLVARVPDVTRLLDGMDKRGLIERHRGREDRRVVRVRITGRGLAVLGAIDEPLLAVHRRHFAHMARAEVRELIRLLDRVREGLAQPGHPRRTGGAGG